MVEQRKALGRLWTDRCTVTVYDSVTDNITKRMSQVERVLVEDLPCRISYGVASSISSAGDGFASALTQEIKLILSQDVEIPPGSKINVSRGGVSTDYGRSGEPARYSNHQEITLELWKGWA